MEKHTIPGQISPAATAAPDFIESSPHRTTVLLVDHDLDEMDMMKDQLKALGFEVLTARNAISALSRFVLYRPHLVFLEIPLPGIDGFEALKKMQLQSKTMGHRARFIMLTEVNTKADIIRSVQCGAHDYIRKPVHTDVFVEKLQKQIFEMELRS